ncbi:MAG: putative Ig domain-containing protein [Thermodesulfobacteriota bacterium]
MHTPLIFCFIISFFLLNISGCDNNTEKSAILENTSKNSPEIKVSEQDPESIDRKTETEIQEQVDQKLNHPPVVESIRIERISGNDTSYAFRAFVEAKDPDNDAISFGYQWKLDGEDIPGATDEMLEWREEFKKGSIISVGVIPFDGKDEGVWKAEGSFTIPNSPPIITSEPVPRIEDGKLSYVLKAEDPDGDPIEYTLKNAPRGMTIEPATGLIAWKFGEADIGEHTVEIIVTDSEGARASQMLTLNISRQNQ